MASDILISSIVIRLSSLSFSIPDCSFMEEGSIYFNFLPRIMSASKLLFPADCTVQLYRFLVWKMPVLLYLLTKEIFSGQ